MKSTKVFEVHWMEPGENFKKKHSHLRCDGKTENDMKPGENGFFSGGTHHKTNLPFEGKSTLMHFQTSKRTLNLKDMLRVPQLPTSGHISRPFVILGLLDQVQVPRLARETPIKDWSYWWMFIE